MSNNEHHGVGLLITNSLGTEFFLQAKDDLYQFEHWRGSLAFWGGEIEEGETPLFAVNREIEEEIPDAYNMLLQYYFEEIFHGEVLSQEKFNFTLFKVKLSDKEFEEIKSVKVHEGLSKVVKRDSLTLSDTEWIWGLEKVMSEVL